MCTESKKQCFILHAALNWKPMKAAEDRCNVISSLRACDDPRCHILNLLKATNCRIWQPKKQRVPIIQPGYDEGVDQRFCSFQIKVPPYSTDVPKLEVCLATYAGYMFVQRHHGIP